VSARPYSARISPPRTQGFSNTTGDTVAKNELRVEVGISRYSSRRYNKTDDEDNHRVFRLINRLIAKVQVKGKENIIYII